MSSAASQVIEFVRALALGWKNLAAYPPGHPALTNSLNLIHRRLEELRGPAGEITLGIARDGIVYGQEKIDSTYAAKFGNALYTRGVATLRFTTETAAKDIEVFLRLLGAAADTNHPLWDELPAAGVVNIHLEPVDYSEVQVSDDLTSEGTKPETKSVWEEILQAMLAGEGLSPDGERLMAQKVESATELATLVEQYAESVDKPAKFDPDATFGVRFVSREPGEGAHAIAAKMATSVGAYLSGSSGSKRDVAVQQAVELLKALPNPMRAAVMRAVVRVLATDESAAKHLRQVAGSVERDEILETFRSLSDSTPMSNHAMRLVESLMATAKPVIIPDDVSPQMIADIVHLFGDDDVDRFNPDDHRELLDKVAIQMPQHSLLARPLTDLGDRLETVTPVAINVDLTQTLLFLLRERGPRASTAVTNRLQAIFRAYVSAAQFEPAIHLVRELQDIARTTKTDELRAAIQALFEKLGSTETIKTLLNALHASPGANAPVIHRLLELLGTAATRNLLLALAEENNRSRRRRLFDFVASLGPAIVPEIKGFLTDSRWYVVRNMIVLLRTVNDRTLLAEMRGCASHPDMRVRLEAIKSLLTLEPNLPVGLLEDAIHDPDPKMAETAITLIGSYGIKEAVGPLLRVVQGNDVFGAKRPLRIRAIKALGELAEPKALASLNRFFKDSIFPWPAREERRAAYESLAGYPATDRAPIVEKGLRSRDPQVREICKKIANGH